jgi:hypothetical protein
MTQYANKTQGDIRETDTATAGQPNMNRHPEPQQDGKLRKTWQQHAC